MGRIYWDFIYGDVTVTVQAVDDDTDKDVTFTFDCFISDELDAYSRLEAVDEAATALAHLRRYHRTDIVDVKKKV